MSTTVQFTPKPIYLKDNKSEENSNSSYCGSHPFLNPLTNGFHLSHCLFHTITIGLFLILLIAVVRQVLELKRKGVAVKAKYIPKSIYYNFQWLCLFLLLVETPVRFVVLWGYVNNIVAGVDILYLCIRLVLLAVTFHLLCIERKFVFRTVRLKRHSNTFLLTCMIIFLIEILSAISWNDVHWWFLQQNPGEKVLFGLWITRLIFSTLLFLIGLWSPGVPKLLIDKDRDIEKSQEEKLFESNEVSDQKQSTWAGIKEKRKLLWPYMWPRGNLLLQIRVLLCICCLIGGRIVNPYVPIFYKKIVNALSEAQPWDMIWPLILGYIGLKCLQGSGFSGGILNSLRLYLWICVQQYTNRHVQVRLFAHLHSLSLRWHLSRKTGEVLRSIDRGTTSINNLLSYIVFSIAPTICDIIIAIVYFIAAFNAWFGLAVFVCLALYLACTIVITEWRTKYRRDMNTKDNKAKQRAIDSLLNFETVKYYNAENYEVKRFDEAVLDFQESEYFTSASLVLLNFSQNFIINMGLLAGSLLCAHYVSGGTLKIGDFVLFGTYIVQLYTPLGFFGTYYRVIQTAFIDMENMLELFKEGQEVQDKNEAVPLTIKKCSVEFKDVCFHYVPEKEILKNISFRVEPGQTYALVGPSGSGKSTIIRLLFRFYNIQSGVIEVDGTDIATVTKQTLRSCIGVVPQDTILFNDNILNNIRYGRVAASDEEVKEAAVAADIHHRIVNMPKQYDTVVGERGLKLSGGEKQRVAIARTILKAPNIVLLDEATSALDTQTERNIQSSLSRVCAGRTTIVVAHRLSTIVNADCILVLKDGEIVERGSHDELLSHDDGVYADMWKQQLKEMNELKGINSDESEKK